jgi:hypothetical protein
MVRHDRDDATFVEMALAEATTQLSQSFLVSHAEFKGLKVRCLIHCVAKISRGSDRIVPDGPAIAVV